MNDLNEFIDSVAKVETRKIGPNDEPVDVFVSKTDGSYISMKGQEEKDFSTLRKMGITEQIQGQKKGGTAVLGFNPEEQAWYGWSHRAIAGFKVGSIVKKGSAAYRDDRGEWVAKTEEDAKQMAKDFAEGVS